jgi:hypothetical protein
MVSISALLHQNYALSAFTLGLILKNQEVAVDDLKQTLLSTVAAEEEQEQH